MEHSIFLGLCITDGCLLTFSVPFSKFPLFLSNEGGNRWIIDETSGFYGIFQIFQRIYPNQTNSHTKDELFNPS